MNGEFKLGVSVFILLLILVFSVFILWPKFKEVSGLKNKISQTEKYLESTKQYLEELEEKSKQIEENKEKILKLNQILPEKENLPHLFSFIRKLATESGLLLTNVSFAQTLPPEGSGENLPLKEIQINLELKGNYPSFKNFISQIEKSARLFEPLRISLTKTEKEKDVLEIKIDLKIFSL